MEKFTIIWEGIKTFFNPVEVFLTSAYRIAQVGTAFSYFMWFLLFILLIAVVILTVKLRLYMVPVIPIIIVSKFLGFVDGMKDDDKDGIRNKKDKDRNGDGILDRFQSKFYVRKGSKKR